MWWFRGNRKAVADRAVRRAAWVIGALALFIMAIATLDLQPNLARVKVGMLSGTEGGRYYALVSELADEARREKGQITNLPTQGSVENLAQLSDARSTCRAHFALVQDGLDWPAGLEFVARLPRPESVFILGRHADAIRSLTDLRGLRIGIGPEGSGTALVARRIFESRDLAGLGVTLVNLPLDAQVSALQFGSLDLGVIVMDEDAPIIDRAVRERGLQIMSLPFAETIAKRRTYVRAGRIEAGHYDALRVLPSVDKAVLQVDTLVVGNGCAKRAATTGLLTLLMRVSPGLIERNRDMPAPPNLAAAAASRSFFENGGPDIATAHLPWAVDIMPLSNWIYVITAVSLLFNGMGLWSRFRLWRIDARRVKVEERLAGLFGDHVTPAEIARLKPTPEHMTIANRVQVADLISAFEMLNATCRRQSLSIVSDMGQEMPYRYQERLMSEFIDALRRFRMRVERQASDVSDARVSVVPEHVSRIEARRSERR